MPAEIHTFKFPIDTLISMEGVANLQGTTVPELLFMSHLRRSMFQRDSESNERIAGLMEQTREEARAAFDSTLDLPLGEVAVKMPEGVFLELGRTAIAEGLASVEEYLVASYGSYVADEQGDLAQPLL